MNEQVANSENALEAQAANAEITPILDLKIGKESGGQLYPVTILNTPAGPDNAPMHFPFTTAELKDYLIDLRFALLFTSKRSPNTLSQREESVQKFGEQLFDALIAGEARICYDALKQQVVEKQGMPLQIRLRIEDPVLSALPWELLYDSRTATYVCSSENVSIIRYTEVAQPVSPLQVQCPLYILGMIAVPDDLDPIDREHQKSLFEQALKDLKGRDLVELHWLEEGTWKALQQRLEDKKETPCHIFHLIGHGRYNSQSGQGKVAFMTENGETNEIETQQLANLLINHSSLRLIVLDASEGPSGHELDVFSNTATTLVSTGIPAVLTTQYKHTDQVSIEFYRTFYDSLAQGTAVDRAVSKARQGIDVATGSTLSFGAFSLHTNSTESDLFEILVKEKHKYFPGVNRFWLGSFVILLLVFLVSSFLWILSSFIFEVGYWTGFLIPIAATSGVLLGAVTGILIGIAPHLFKSVNLRSYIAALLAFPKRLWPPYRSSRRWFLKGAAIGVGLIAIVEVAGYNVLKNLPKASPTPKGLPKLGDLVGEYDGSTDVYSISWSPKTNYIAIAGSDGTVHLWEWQITASPQATPIEKIPFVGHSYGGNTENVNAVAWFPDGTKLASGGDDKTVQIWDFATSARIYTYTGHKGSVYSVACSPDGKYIASGSADHTVQVFDASTGNHLYTYYGHLDAVTAVTWSPDSKRIASGSADKTVQVWDAFTGNHIVKQTQHQERVNAVAWAPDRDDSRIASASSDGATAVLIWDASSGTVIYPHILEGGATSVVWSPTGQRIACGGSDTGMQVWDSAANNLNRVTFAVPSADSVVWSHDALHIASSDRSDYRVQVWQAV